MAQNGQTLQKIMNTIFALIVLTIIANGAVAQGRNAGAFQIEERNGPYTAKIFIRARAAT